MHPFVLGQGSGPCSVPRFCGAGCPVAPFFGSIHYDDTRSSESSLQDPNLFDQVCTGHLASARFDRHHHWPSCHVGSPWPHSRFCASCSLTWRAIFPQPIFHSISPSSSQSSQLVSLTAAVVIGFAIGCLPPRMVADANARRITTSWKEDAMRWTCCSQL